MWIYALIDLNMGVWHKWLNYKLPHVEYRIPNTRTRTSMRGEGGETDRGKSLRFMHCGTNEQRIQIIIILTYTYIYTYEFIQTYSYILVLLILYWRLNCNYLRVFFYYLQQRFITWVCVHAFVIRTLIATKLLFFVFFIFLC